MCACVCLCVFVCVFVCGCVAVCVCVCVCGRALGAILGLAKHYLVWLSRSLSASRYLLLFCLAALFSTFILLLMLRPLEELALAG